MDVVRADRQQHEVEFAIRPWRRANVGEVVELGDLRASVTGTGGAGAGLGHSRARC